MLLDYDIKYLPNYFDLSSPRFIGSLAIIVIVGLVAYVVEKKLYKNK